ncbi:uncharacterized protein LOC119676342 [Teleopsis dalmanni]|uniref:uncharacterized protein LOC119676342 n=1 Tax=Teleopsis dalmanni TaxID=139649 RepID=UPI0018CC8631|nr:uncharacterized protein LOC119676342 [Teleopsis dalmanni]
MEWRDNRVFQLIELYRNKECLWDCTSPNYKNIKMKHDAWTNIAHDMEIDVNDIKKKMNSLLSSFRRERKKQKEKKSGSAADEQYKFTWFGSKAMEFLLDKFQPKNVTDVGLQEVCIHLYITNIYVKSFCKFLDFYCLFLNLT